MKKLALLAMIITFICLSCEKVEDDTSITVCDGKQLEDMQWFRDIQEGKTECTIYPTAILTLHQYNGKQVFYLLNMASSQWVCGHTLYDCSGEIISTGWTEKQWSDFREQHPNGKIVWRKLD